MPELRGPGLQPLPSPALCRLLQTQCSPAIPASEASSQDSAARFHSVCSPVSGLPKTTFHPNECSHSAQNETRVPHGLLLGHTLIATLEHQVGYPVTMRFTLYGTMEISGFKAGVTSYREDTATSQNSSKINQAGTPPRTLSSSGGGGVHATKTAMHSWGPHSPRMVRQFPEPTCPFSQPQTERGAGSPGARLWTILVLG